MSEDLIKRTDASPAALDNLARRINAEHEAAIRSARTAIEHAIACGSLLLEAKATVPHGQWLPWLQANTIVSERTAQRWMRYAEHAETLLAKSDTDGGFTFAEADRLLAAPKSTPEARALAAEHLGGDFPKAARAINALESSIPEYAGMFDREMALDLRGRERDQRRREARALFAKIDHAREEAIAGCRDYTRDRDLFDRCARYLVKTWAAHGEEIATDPDWEKNIPPGFELPGYVDHCRRIYAMSAEERRAEAERLIVTDFADTPLAMATRGSRSAEGRPV